MFFTTTELLSYMISALPASQARIAFLRLVQQVSKTCREAANACLADAEWHYVLQQRAGDFCDGGLSGVWPQRYTILVEGTPVLRTDSLAIDDMLAHNRFEDLKHEMHEYASDETTQLIIFRKMSRDLVQRYERNKLYFMTQMGVAKKNTKRNVAAKSGIANIVSYVMRVHTNNAQIRAHGVCILSVLKGPVWTYETDLTAYIVGSIAAVMHRDSSEDSVCRSSIAALDMIMSSIFAEDGVPMDDSDCRTPSPSPPTSPKGPFSPQGAPVGGGLLVGGAL